MHTTSAKHNGYPTFCDAALRLAMLDPEPRTRAELDRFEQTFLTLTRTLPAELQAHAGRVIETVKTTCGAPTEPSCRIDRVERDLHQLCRMVNG